MANTDPISWRLFDTDLTTALGYLPVKGSHLYLELNEPGSGKAVIPLDSEIASLVSSSQFVESSYRGSIRGGFFVENIDQEHANNDEGGGRLMSITGRGALALLEDAIVWDDGTGATSRLFDGMPKAAIMIALMDEAQARGGLSTLTVDFDVLDDSDGNAWSDNESIDLPVGKTLLDVLRMFAGLGVDFEINPDGAGNFVLSAWRDGLGTDKSETVYFRIGQNCVEFSEDEVGGKIKNVLRVKHPGGFTTVQDATSITNRRRRELLVNAEEAANSQVALSFGQAKLTSSKDPLQAIILKIFDGVSPKLFEDYVLGDTIMLDRFGVETPHRIVGIQADWDGHQYANVQINLNSMPYEWQLKLAQQVTWLTDQWNTARDAGKVVASSFWAAIGATDNDGFVTTLVAEGTKLYVGGNFTRIGGINANHIAIYDLITRQWSALGTGTDDDVNAIAVLGSDVYVGGEFTTAGGISANYIAKWDGSAWSALGTGLGSQCFCLTVYGSDIIAGGTFTTAGGASAIRIAKWSVSGSAWSALGTGLNGSPQGLAADGATLYVVGTFTTAGGTTVNKIAKWNGSAWSLVGSLFFQPTDTISCVLVLGTNVYVGGNMPAQNHAAVFTGVWESVGNGLDGSVQSIATDGINVYYGGHFTNIALGGPAANRVAGWNGGSWFALGSGVDDSVYALACYGSEVYVGGEFLNAGGKASKYIAVYISTFEDLIEYLENSPSTFDMAAAIHNAPSKSPIVAADEMGFWDSISGALRKISWTGILASIKTYTDTLYSLLGHVHDASTVTYTPTNVTNWDSSTDPGDVDNALDQLAQRLTDGSSSGVVGPDGIHIDGALAVETNVSNALLITVDTTIDIWYIYCKNPGSASSTIVDMNLNGVTIFTTQANRPTLVWNDANGWAVSGSPDFTDFVEGDVLTFDIDQIGTGAADLVIVPLNSALGSGGGGSAATGLTPFASDYIIKVPVEWMWSTNRANQGSFLPFPINYDDGIGGVGATLTNDVNGALPDPIAVETRPRDSIVGATAGTITVGDRILYNDAYSDGWQGIYTVTDKGSAGTPWILTRATDCDADAERLAFWQVNLEGTSIVARRTKSTDLQFLGLEVESGPGYDPDEVYYGGSIAIGDRAEATRVASIAIGEDVTADGFSSIAIGRGIESRDGEIVVGDITGGTYTWKRGGVFSGDGTLDRSHANAIVDVESATPVTITVPPQTSPGPIDFYRHTSIELLQKQSGIITLAPGAGVTILGDLSSTGRYSSLILIKLSTNDWRSYSVPIQRKMAVLNAPVASVAATEKLLLAAKVEPFITDVGCTYRIKVIGISSSTGTLIFRVRVGTNGSIADTEAWISLTSAAQAANQRAGFEAMLTVRSIGPTGTIQCEGQGFAEAAILPTVVGAVATQTIDTEAEWFIDITVISSVGTFTAQHAVVERI